MCSAELFIYCLYVVYIVYITEREGDMGCSPKLCTRRGTHFLLFCHKIYLLFDLVCVCVCMCVGIPPTVGPKIRPDPHAMEIMDMWKA